MVCMESKCNFVGVFLITNLSGQSKKIFRFFLKPVNNYDNDQDDHDEDNIKYLPRKCHIIVTNFRWNEQEEERNISYSTPRTLVCILESALIAHDIFFSKIYTESN